MSAPPPSKPRLIAASGVADHTGFAASPGCVLLEPGRPLGVLAAGTPAEVLSHPAAAHAERISMPGSVLIPGLVNAHTHLDLTSIGPRAFDRGAGFSAWLSMVREHRAVDPQDIHRSVGEGVRRSLAGGVVAVGDIAGGAGDGCRVAAMALMDSPLWGVSFIELFGDGPLPEWIVALANRRGGVCVGVQPHAPYSAGPDLYRAALASGLPVATHLGESMAERELLTRGTGPIRGLLELLGVWTDRHAERYGRARSSVSYLRESIVSGEPILLAHVNDADDADLELLAESDCTVVYCPRAHEYFSHDKQAGGEGGVGPHRYREMLDAGIRVALGTDSIINLPESESRRISTLDEMRLLWRRHRTDPRTLLRMATANGARALGLDAALFDFAAGQIAGVVAVDVSHTDAANDPLVRVMQAGGGCDLIAHGGAATRAPSVTPGVTPPPSGAGEDGAA